MARKTVLVCDNCGSEVDEAQGASLRVTYSDARRGSKVADLCDECAGQDARPRRRPPRPPAEEHRRRPSCRAAKPVEGGPGHVLRPLYDGKVGLSLLAGPAHAGKVALLLERYLARLDDEPVLIVPNRSDVDRVERDLLGRCGCLLGGTIGTFDDLFARLAAGDPGGDAVAGDAAARAGRAPRARRRRRSTASPARRARPASPTRSCGRSASSSPACSTRPTSTATSRVLYAAYRAELDRLGLWDRDPQRRRAAERLADRPRRVARRAGLRLRLRGPDRRRVDAARGARRPRRGRRLAAVRARAASRSRRSRARPTTSPRSPTARSRSSPPRSAEYAHPALAHLERALFEESPPPRRELDGAVRFLEGAGARGTLELVGDELLELIRGGTAAGADRARRAVARRAGARRSRRCSARSASRTRVESRARLGATPFGHALLAAAALRLARTASRARALRVPALAVLRARRARRSTSSKAGCAAARSRLAERVEEEAEKLREAPIPRSPSCAAPTSRSPACARCSGAMLRSAYGTEAPPAGETSRLDLRAYDAVLRLLDELDGLAALGGEATPRGRGRRARARPRCGSPAPARPAASPCSTCCARARGASRSSSCSGSRRARCRAAQRGVAVPRRRRAAASSARRLERPDQVSRDRYLFYTACTRATRRLYLVREAATDDGAPREPSPFWDEVAARLRRRGRRARDARGAPLSALTWPLDGAPTERERLRALAPARRRRDRRRALARSPTRTAGSGGSTARARRFDAATRLREPARARVARRARRRSASPSSSASPTARRRGSSSASSRPKTIDAEVDPMLRGSVAHSALHKFYAGLPKELGARPRHAGERRAGASASCARCLDDALRGGVRLELTDLQEARARRERSGATSRGSSATRRESPLQLVPRRFEVGVRLRALGARAAARPRRSATGFTSAARSTASTSTRSARAGSCRTTSRAARRTRRSRSTRSCGCRSRSTCSCCATSSASSRSAASTARSPARA